MLSKNTEQLKIEIAEHIATDAVVQGAYWENGKGCFRGCLTHTNETVTIVEKFGFPIELIQICERIFEGLSIGEAKDFFSKIGDAIDVDGKDLSKIHWSFLKEILENLPSQKPEIQKVIAPVIEGMDLLSKGLEWPSSDPASIFVGININIAAYLAYTIAVYAHNVARAAYDPPYVTYAAASAYVVYDAFATYVDPIEQKEIILKLLKKAPIHQS